MMIEFIDSSQQFVFVAPPKTFMDAANHNSHEESHEYFVDQCSFGVDTTGTHERAQNDSLPEIHHKNRGQDRDSDSP